MSLCEHSICLRVWRSECEGEKCNSIPLPSSSHKDLISERERERESLLKGDPSPLLLLLLLFDDSCSERWTCFDPLLADCFSFLSSPPFVFLPLFSPNFTLFLSETHIHTNNFSAKKRPTDSCCWCSSISSFSLFSSSLIWRSIKFIFAHKTRSDWFILLSFNCCCCDYCLTTTTTATTVLIAFAVTQKERKRASFSSKEQMQQQHPSNTRVCSLSSVLSVLFCFLAVCVTKKSISLSLVFDLSLSVPLPLNNSSCSCLSFVCHIESKAKRLHGDIFLHA